MIYQETYQAGGDPTKLNIIGVLYTHNLSTFLPPPVPKRNGFPSHCHSFYEMDYTIEGISQFEFENRVVDVAPGSLVFIPPLTMHSIKNDSRNSNFILQFSSRLLLNTLSSMEEHCILIPSGILKDRGSLRIVSGTAIDKMIHELIENVPTILLPVPEDEVQLAGYPCQQEIRLSAALLSLLSVLLDSGLLRIESTELNTSSLAKMQMLLSRLISHPEDKLSMEDAAALTNMSYSNFCRSFKSTIGYSYVDFCNVVRIHRAQELLLHSQMSVTEISELLNFGSISYFNRIFKKHTGCTPLTYRSSRR